VDIVEKGRGGLAMSDERASSASGISIDPICGRSVSEAGAESFEYKRRTYFFCSRACKGRFERQAERARVDELARMGVLFAAKKARWGVA
jgi:YHS domain-containing protein